MITGISLAKQRNKVNVGSMKYYSSTLLFQQALYRLTVQERNDSIARRYRTFMIFALFVKKV